MTEKSRGVRLEFAAEDQVVFFGDKVIIKVKAQNTLHKYELQLPKMIYQEMRMSEDLPHGVNTASVMAVRWGNILLQDKSTSTTLQLSCKSTKLLDSWRHEGILLSYHRHVDNRNQFMYAVEKTYGEYEIVIVEMIYHLGCSREFRDIVRLQPVGTKPTWSHPYLSVCLKDQKLAVTSTEHTLDIYCQDYTSK